jgi:hypothetical protein
MLFISFFVLLVHFFYFPCSDFSCTFLFAYLHLFLISVSFLSCFFHRPFLLSFFSVSLCLCFHFFPPYFLLLIQQSSAVSKFSTAVRAVLVLHVDYIKAFRTSLRPPCKRCHNASNWAATASFQILYTLFFTLSSTRRFYSTSYWQRH